jgi:rubrerythrin
MNTETFIVKANNIHNNKYDYSKVNYINSYTKVCIICPIHGEFYKTPDNHTNGKQGCPVCSHKKKLTTEEFIRKAKEIHGDKYDYSKVKYKNSKEKVHIICPIHGKFWQTPDNHIHHQGCPFCKKDKLHIERKNDVIHFIQKAKEIHGNKYDYSEVNYINNRTKVYIICYKHGGFWQTPTDHLNGNGCPICKESHLERDIRLMLENNNIKYEYQKRFDWLGRQSLDFYLPDYNIGIECQGIQHFKPINRFGGIKSYEKCVYRDKIKYDLCILNNIKIIYYTNINNNNINAIYDNKIYYDLNSILSILETH